MIYQLYEYSRALLAPTQSMAETGALLFSDPASWFARLPGADRIAAGYELLHRISKAYEKPAWEIAAFEETVLEKPFCHLKHFKSSSSTGAPAVLLVAPLSGHYATLLRDTVRTLLPSHEVYVTDWLNARTVPVEQGAFTLAHYIAYVREFMRTLGAARLHVMAVCQPSAPVLAATALMATAHEAGPRSLTLMGGPVDTRVGLTKVNEFATGHSVSWFESYLTDEVPSKYPGRGRRVYPGFLLHAGFMALNPVRHIGSHVDFYRHLVRGDLSDAAEHRRFYDEFNAVMDLPAEYYLECIKVVFQDHLLPRGLWYVEGERVAPEAIVRTPLLTIEGELDNISGPGQTRAAHDLCTGIPPERKHHLTVEGAGHYGIFSGRRWRERVYPKVERFIADAEAGAT